MMVLVLGLVLVLAGGVLALLFERRAGRFAVGGQVLGSLFGLWFALGVLLRGDAPALSLPWSVPYGSFTIGADPLSAFFLLLLFLLFPVAAIYGIGYLAHEKHRLGPPWFFYNLLAVSIALVLVARNAVLFLVAWEVMSLASYFLVVFEDERLEVRRAGWTYLVATHIGTAFLLAFFVLLGQRLGSLELTGSLGARATHTGVLFLLALVGFGTKAGLVPLHIWLPEAHPAAPSHVSAVMSGVMIKAGVYGILRTLLLLGPMQPWWSTTLVAVGVVTGVVGAAFALSQRDLKRLLAYSSVENVGLITIGIGVGVLGVTRDVPVIALLGFGAALFHALNHALFKGLLFLGAGVVKHETGTLELDALGGLLKRLPFAGLAFLVGAAAISALPPFNGFVSELLLLAGALEGAAQLRAPAVWPALLAVTGVALIGGLAVVAFVKASAIGFLGSPRSAAAAAAHEPGRSMLLPLLVLAAACALIGVIPDGVWLLVRPAAAQLSGGVPTAAADPVTLLAHVGRAGALLLFGIGLLWLLRLRLHRGRSVRTSPVWACGYPEPIARAQYTGSSLVEPVAAFLDPLIPGRDLAVQPPKGLFAREAWVKSASADVFGRRVYAPAFSWIRDRFSSARRIQHGQLQWYLLYIFLTLIALLAWELGVRR